MGTNLGFRQVKLPHYLELLDGLLLPADVDRPAVGLLREEQPRAEHRDAAQDLEAGHVHLQREEVLPAHDHHAEQVHEAISQREGALLTKVGLLQLFNQDVRLQAAMS